MLGASAHTEEAKATIAPAKKRKRRNLKESSLFYAQLFVTVTNFATNRVGSFVIPAKAGIQNLLTAERWQRWARFPLAGEPVLLNDRLSQ